MAAMHIFANLSHWVCVVTGLFLIMAGLTSHTHTQAASSVSSVESRDTHQESTRLKRAVLIGIGLLAIAYGVSRVYA